MTTYRRRSHTCPACDGVMQLQETSASALDICADCGGVWMDWFDGNPIATAKTLDAHAGARPAKPGAWHCPECRVPMTHSRYPTESDGAWVARCGTCAGTFVAAAELRTLAHSPLRNEDSSEDPGWLRELITSIGAWIQR